MLFLLVLAQAAPVADSANPLVIAGYVLGAVIAIPVLAAIVKVIFFVAAASSKLEATSSSCTKMEEGFSEFRHEMRNQTNTLDKRLYLVEQDVDRFVPIHPDSRIGRMRAGDRPGADES